MKLGELKSAIRAHKGNPSVATMTPGPNGVSIMVTVQKSSILKELDSVFEHKNSETGYELSETGELLPGWHAPEEAASEPVDTIDLDLDLDLGDIDLADL